MKYLKLFEDFESGEVVKSKSQLRRELWHKNNPSPTVTTNNINQIKDKPNINESFNIDEDSEHLKDLSLDLKDEGNWTVNVYTNTEKYNDDEYSCKVILEPLDEFDWDAPGINDRGGQINDTLIQYLEDIIKYLEDYEYKIILTSDNATIEEEIILNSIGEFKKWIEQQLKHQLGDIMTYGYKKDLIIIEFYEKE